MYNSPERPVKSEETEQTTPPEPGALFLRVESKTVQPLTTFRADVIEGLLSLMESDDWKSTFIANMLHGYRNGDRESPADVRWGLDQAAHQFEMELDVARSMYQDYRPLFQPETSGRETRTAKRTREMKPKGKRGARR